MPSAIRIRKIEDRIRDELAEMFLYEIEDPRLSGVMVTDVKVDRELEYASIYVSAVEGIERSGEVIEALTSAAGYIRRGLAQSVELRQFPRLRFYWDPTPENAARMEELFHALERERIEKRLDGGTDAGSPDDGTDSGNGQRLFPESD